MRSFFSSARCFRDSIRDESKIPRIKFKNSFAGKKKPSILVLPQVEQELISILVQVIHDDLYLKMILYENPDII